MFGYIYLVRNKINGKMYIGQKHSEVFDPTYFGSGVYLKRALSKYGVENFEHVKVLEWCESKETLDLAERYWIDHYNAVESPQFYNLAKGGIGTTAGSKRSDTFKAKIAITTGRRIWKDSSKVKISRSVSGRVWVNNGETERHVTKEEFKILTKQGFIKGRLPFSEDQIRKISEKRKGHCYESEESLRKRSDTMTGEGNPFFGKTHSEEQKEIWKEMRKEMVWVNKNGINTVIHSDHVEDYLSKGWVRGMIRKSPASNKGRLCINNGSCNKYVSPEEVNIYLDQGWTRGKVSKKSSTTIESIGSEKSTTE